MRVCDVLEVLSCKTCNSGCYLDGERIWTSTPCASGEADLCIGSQREKSELEQKLAVVPGRDTSQDKIDTSAAGPEDGASVSNFEVGDSDDDSNSYDDSYDEMN